MKENMDSNFDKLQEGEYLWKIYEISEQQKKEKCVQRTWKLNTIKNGEVNQVWFHMRPFEYYDILKVLGYEKDKNGDIDWEAQDILGKRFKAKLSYRKFNDKEYPRITETKPVEETDEEIPF